MATNTSGGTTASLSNTPQAKADTFYRGEDLTGITMLDVMLNDLAGNAKILWSVDDSATDTAGATDLISTDIGKIEATSTDTSANGAKIWIQDGKVAYQSDSLSAAFKAALQALAVGQTMTDTFTYAIRMSNGTLSWNTATIVFSGVNDAPDISVGSGDSASETLAETDVALSTNGSLTVVDPDTSDSVAVSITGFAKSGNAGSLTDAQLQAMLTLTETSLAANAGDASNLHWAFSSGAVNFDYLADGESLTLTYTITAEDNHDATDTQTVTITISGSNDGPQIVAGGALNGGVEEESGSYTASGSFGFTDVDSSDTHSVTATPGGPGYLGTFTPNVSDDSTGDGSGTIGWSFSVANADLQFLGEGETRTQAYTVVVDDGNGGTASEVVTIVLTGDNDPIVITSTAQSGNRSEDDASSVGGTIMFSDVDLSDTHTAGFAPAATNTTSLGTFAIDPSVTEAPNAASGSLGWTYTVDTLSAQYLAVGESAVEHYEVTFSDGHGGTVTETVKVTITGANDEPLVVAGGDLDGAVEEDSLVYSDSGSFGFTDVDLSDIHSVTATPGGPGYLGIFTPSVSDDSTGGGSGTIGWSFSVANADLQFLGEGETRTQAYTVVVDDGNGGTASEVVTIVLTGDNDPIVITSDAQADSLSEDGTSVGGTITFSDIDLSDAHTASAAANAGNTSSLGSFSIDPAVTEAPNAANGSLGWSYTVNNAAAQYLAVGESVVEQYDVTFSDGHGGFVTETVTVTITGSNDGPDIRAIVGDSAGHGFNESNIGLSVSGTLTVTDPDTSDEVDTSVSLAVAGNQGPLSDSDLLGMFSITSGDDDLAADTGDTHNLSWSFDSDSEAFDFLAQGQVLTLTYTLTSDDGNGSTDTQDVTITIAGTNDGPVALADSGTTGENAPLLIDVLANDTDADDGAVLTVTAASAPAGQGSATIVGNQVQFDPGTDFDYLAVGESALVAVGYTIVDEHGASASSTILITVTGVNDGPVALAVEGDADEDGPSIIVAADFTDADASDTHTFSVDTSATLGSVTNHGDGTFNYDPNGQFEQLAEGETASDTFSYTVDDGNGGSSTETVTITITGSNDAPTVTALVGSAGEDGPVFSQDLLSGADDVDAGTTLSVVDVENSLTTTDGRVLTLGTHYTVSGSTFELTAAGFALFNNLPDGDNDSFTFDYGVSDGLATTANTLTVTIDGTNDGPVANPDGATTGENATVLIDVLANDTDADNGAVLTVTVASAPAGQGTASVVGNQVEFDPGTDFDHLGVGDSVTVTVSYTIEDEHGASSSSTIDILVTGTNDAAVLSSAVVILHETNVPRSASGTLTIDDVDSPETFIPQTDVAGDYGTFSIDAAGNWTYLANSAFDELNNFDTLTDVFLVASADGTTTSVTVTIDGTNDNPVLTGTQAVLPGGTEDINYTIYEADLLAGFTDVDGGELRVSSLTAVNGILTDNLDGTWTFDPTLNFNGTVTLNYSVVDGHGGLVSATNSFTLAPVNDPAHFAGNDVGEVTEDAAPNPINGQLYAVDPDGPSESGFQPQVTAGTYGSFSITASGAWTYTLDNSDPDTDALAASQPAIETFTVASVDGTTTVVTINITGANDAPVALAVTGEADEDGPSITVAADFTDVDAGDSHTFSVNTTGTLGTVTDNGDGTFSYDPNGQFESLADGETATDTFSYTVIDNNGQSSTETVTITVNGQNDAPDAVDDIASIDEDNSVLIDVRANDDDPDDSDVLFITAASVASGLGTVTIEAGQLRYDPGTFYNHLGAGDTATVVLSYTIEDGHGGTDTASVTVTVTGAADGVVPPPTETGADPNDFDSLVGTASSGFILVNGSGAGDTITGDTSSNDKDIINGFGGNDTINAGDATDQVYGGTGNDIINGGDNSDLLYGQAGTDTIHGNQISDDIYGGSEDDAIFGDAGDDNIYGGSGTDTINGGTQNDIITGGYGADTLTGGDGNDTFRYLSTLDTNDVIVDFMGSGNDQIDLSAIDAVPGGANNPFDWGGTTATANGVWFSYDAGTNTTTLYADTDGDEATAEFMLTLQGYNGLNGFGNPLGPNPPDITL